MRSVNKVILVGNLTRDPELKQTTNGQSIVTFGLATNREWVTKPGEKKSLAEYHNIAAWGRLAEICQNYLKKGKLVYVEGYLKTRSWDSPEGVKIFRTEVVATDMIMLDKRPTDSEEDYVPSDDNTDENMFDPDTEIADITGEETKDKKKK
jgi:single-strand DNA-binding protein